MKLAFFDDFKLGVVKDGAIHDVSAAVKELAKKWQPARVVLCGRSDAALVACLTAATDPGVTRVAVEGLPPGVSASCGRIVSTIAAALRSDGLTMPR